MTARTHGVVVLGVEGHVVDVEVHIAPGLVGTTIVGLPDTAVGESRDRAKAAVQNSGCRWPDMKVTVGLSPAALHKRGPMLDLAI
ncbi:MAG: ATP-binding protein, partial [Actinomycetales bacterium]|nr:ATP-binding protein [Actinomycetales bacterium]